MKKEVKKEPGSIDYNFDNAVKNVTPGDLFHAKLAKIVEEDIFFNRVAAMGIEIL